MLYAPDFWHMRCSQDVVAKPIRILLVSAWLICLGVGVVILARYERTSGRVGGTPEQWPGHAAFSLHPWRSTLVMFAHPHCPCTRASIDELNRLLVKCEKR